MDLRKLKTLIDLVSESNVSELEITEADGKVRIVKAGAAPVVMMQAAPQAAQAVAAAPAAVEAVPVVPAPIVGSRSCGEVADGRHLLPCLQPGRQTLRRGRLTMVKEGEPICIIEAMKIMNEIEADTTEGHLQDPLRERPGGRVRPASHSSSSERIAAMFKHHV
jgi:acetyl-CoA carboxylase biotin carboxyl carrier protein